MKRFLPIERETLLGAAEAVMELTQPAVADLALEVTLLLEGLTSSLTIRPSKGPTLQLVVTEGHRAAKAVVTRESDNSMRFALSRNLAEYLQAALLRAYRDQTAEANHLHIEGLSDGEPFDLTVMFEVFREPMTAKQAGKLLRD